ncbi:hypothetical protein ABPG74_004866 [Tetrahymena malaccensis]
MSHFNIDNPYEYCQCQTNLDIYQQQSLCDFCFQKKFLEDRQEAASKSYQEFNFEQSKFQEESNQINYIYNQQQPTQLQLSNQDLNPLLSFSNQLEIPQSAQFDQQNFLQEKVINPLNLDQCSNKQYEKEYNSQNNLNCFSTQFPDTQINLKSSYTSPYSSPSSKSSMSQKISSLSPQLSQKSNIQIQNLIGTFNNFNYQKNKDLKSSSSIKSNYQSVIKNNIRDFLTPIVRMKTGFVDYELLEKENLSSFQYHDFLKQHFCVAGRRSLKIRQQTFDSLFDCKQKTQLKEKKVLALIAIKTFQTQFIKLLIDKKSQLDEHKFKLQFDWINSINDTLITFLNSL